MKYVVGNWKSNKSIAEVQRWIADFQTATSNLGFDLSNFNSKNVTAVLCPGFVHLSFVKNAVPGLHLGAQTLSAYPNGSYTGAVSALMAREFVTFAILGHTERRKYFGENDRIVANQAIQSLENSITPIVAVDKENWSTQLAQFNDNQLKKIIVMYEPAEAISTSSSGKPADLQEVIEALQLIKGHYSIKAGLYGGSVTSQNALHYLSETEIDGVVPGRASLDAQEFGTILRHALTI